MILAPSCLQPGALSCVRPPSGGSPQGRAWTPARHVAPADRLGVSGAPTAAAKWLPGRESGVTSSPLCSNSTGLFGVPATSVCRDRVCLASNLRHGPCLVTLGGAPRPLGADVLLARRGGALGPGSRELAGVTPCVPSVPHVQSRSVSWAPMLWPLLLAGGVRTPGLWDPAPAKSQISECFCFSLQCVPLGPFGDLGLGEPVSQPLSKALVPVTEATSAGNDPRGQTGSRTSATS